MTYIYIAVEDDLSESVVRRIARESEVCVAVCLNKSGNGALRKRIPELVRLAPNIPVLLLTDLDRTECAPSLISTWLNGLQLPASLMFRVAVREVEAWVLADREGFARFGSLPLQKIPEDPEELPDPKQTLLNLASKYSRVLVKNGVVANYGSGPQPGIAYNLMLRRFVENEWSLERAAESSDSLHRTIRRVRELVGSH